MLYAHPAAGLRSPVHGTRESSSQRWRFGIFEVDARRSELRRGGTTVKLREQSFRILVLLLECAGDIVTREELRQALWPADTYVDFDHSLNTAVMKLRDALGDSADKPLYIETIPKRGYRFVAPLSQAGDLRMAAPTGASETDTGSVARATAEPVEQLGRRPLIGYTVGAFCLLLIASIGAIVFLRSHRLARAPDNSQAAQPLRIVPITAAAGNAISPVFSPDGREIAFVWDGPDRQRYDLYLQLIGAETPLRLTHNPGGLLGRPDGLRTDRRLHSADATAGTMASTSCPRSEVQSASSQRSAASTRFPVRSPGSPEASKS